MGALMSTITFYRQARRDGGIRTGIEIGGDTVLSRFEEGQTDADPAIVWYVDVRCESASLPKDARGAQELLVGLGVAVIRLLEDLANDIPAGIDPQAWPIGKRKKLKSGITISVACSAVRRMEASRMSQTLRDIATHWRELIDELAEVEA